MRCIFALSLLIIASVLCCANAAPQAPPTFQGIGPDNVTQLYGYIPVHNGTRHLFYWMFESRSNPKTDPFVLWLTGGPGCSSLVALFFENGPYKINNDLSLSINPYSWNNNATVIWVDQPVGTGFSYSEGGDIGVITEQEMAQDMYEFLQGFFTLHSKYLSSAFYVFGESYGGHYVPALSARIYQGNQNKEGLIINLQGSAIGNGLVDPYIQYNFYPIYASDHKILNNNAIGLMKAMTPVCVDLIKYCVNNSTLGWLACINAYTMCNLIDLVPIEFEGLNPYDVRENCTIQPLCYDLDPITKYLAQPEVMSALGVSGHPWIQCNRIVELKLVFAGDWMLNYADDLPQLLESGHRVLVYAGEYDYICNWYGNHAWPEGLQWSGAEAYHNAVNETWYVDGVEAGIGKSAQGLTFLKVNNAGHMVPYNQPKNALDMFNRFVFGKPFAGDVKPNNPSTPTTSVDKSNNNNNNNNNNEDDSVVFATN